ncbi:alpha/beta fold hydrolase [Rufibacter sediminis]|uniref:Alpha/beta hydrolase n=1 Tax=Rufibacter sediminis TaxID=2762756 RepID=A0ABR6VZ19_9BACT|nr:alpha/beta hydrolase [Rufibacter sediminis]MBC3542205.1 alpha/beta hydrolase [Rufibacter sediminis]
MSPPPLYLLSGLCADERLFQFLTLEHPQPRVIHWITPDPEDTMASYAAKLIRQIEPGQEPPVLLGLSFGGMMVQEMAKQMPVNRLILLSSLTNTRELPLHYRLAGALQLQKWLPLGMFKKWVVPAYWAFGAHSRQEKHILKSILEETDVPFLRWSLNQILQWRHQAPPVKAVVIHGDRDKILPVPNYSHIHLLKGGEHLMVMSRAAEVSALINHYLSESALGPFSEKQG